MRRSAINYVMAAFNYCVKRKKIAENPIHGIEKPAWERRKDVIRPEVGFLLRGDYRGQFLCSRCFVTLIRERLGTNLSTSKIERALNAVFKSPGALTRLPAFLCDLCQTMMPCLGEARPRDSAVHKA